MQDTDIDTFAELQSWVSDKTLVNEEDVFTIDADWVNTANPWADNEVADDITASNYLLNSDYYATTTHANIASLPSLTTVATLISGATGAGFTIDLDVSTLTCTNCIDISSNTNLAAGTNITLTDDTLSVDDSFILNTGDTATGDYTFDSGTFKIDSTANTVGISSSTPTSELSIVGELYADSGTSATSTIEGNFMKCNDGATHCCYTVWGTASSTDICF